MRHYVGYYGGLVLGISFDVTYSTGTGIDHYTYTYTVSDNATIAVVIGSQGETDKLYIKRNGAWVEVTEIYKRVNGAWVKQTLTRTLFDTSTKYVQR